MNVLSGRRHLAATAASLRKVPSKSLSLFVVGVMLLTLPVPAAQAFDKEGAYAEMQELGAQIESAKDDSGALLARYRELSRQMGGDDPANVLGGSKGAAAMGRSRRSLGGTPAGCTTVASAFTQATPTAIPTGPAVVTSTVVVSGAGTYLLDLDLTTFLTHTFAADLDITLMSPAGTIVTLTTDNGAGNDNVFNGTVWDDDANPAGQVPYTTNNGLVTDHAYVNLTTATPLVPEEAFDAFTGENPNGTWTITISDDLAGDGGSLVSWTLNLGTLAVAPSILTGTFTQATPTAIPTGPAVVTSTVVVSGATAGTLETTLQTNLTHTFAADLDITLMSPAGTIVTLTTDNGAGNDNVFNGTVWDDNANPAGQVPYTTNNGLVTDHAYVNLTTATPLTPEESFAAFKGEDPNGTWTITISDDLAGDGGSLDSWAISIDIAACAATVAPAALAVDPAPGNGVLQPNEAAVVVRPSWTNTGAVAIANLTGVLSNFTGPAGPTYTINDAAATYGPIPAAATASCGANCYAVTVAAAARPATHWDASADETVSAGPTTKNWTLHVGDSFTDVTAASGFYRFIETILHHNVTSGCTATAYCPTASTTREAMAVFVLVANDPTGAPPPVCVAGSERFADVPASSGFCRWIEELERRAVVNGCTPTLYCPTADATREQMAVFVLRTLDPALNPPACVAGAERFADVPASSGFCRWIEELERRGVVTGCSATNYCPTAPVTREQMSVFLAVTFGLTLYGL
jgi:subtilisin-like proprotein convertase family protein